ncbi:uncharacterized protein RCO7_14774 [Rhynchosporium graminicola]|uniref:Uncharacterized protein n=1 Tax=Rhynchosporium graminicola TaxID=2792576 RepID=A0A1E1L1X5_9HELO|nr:uncharacterized protein RCO7_14774 [Rhynchosporium commune]
MPFEGKRKQGPEKEGSTEEEHVVETEGEHEGKGGKEQDRRMKEALEDENHGWGVREGLEEDGHGWGA